MTVKELQLAPVGGVAAAAQARRAVGTLLVGAGSSFVSDAQLATSELVTNAVVHASGVVQLLARFDPKRGSLRVEVTDLSSRLPEVLQSAPSAIGGRGLRIVAELSSDWGAFVNQRGKTVWFELVGSHVPSHAADS